MGGVVCMYVCMYNFLNYKLKIKNDSKGAVNFINPN